MDELTYFNMLAAEVIRSGDEKLQKLLAWCDDINIAIKACDGDTLTRHKHSAVTASALLMEAVAIEHLQQNITTRLLISPYNRRDTAITKFTFRIPEGKREIEISVEITDIFGGVTIGNYSFAPITIPMSERTHVERFSRINNSKVAKHIH